MSATSGAALRRGQDAAPDRPHRADRKLYPLSGGAVRDAVHPEHHRIGKADKEFPYLKECRELPKKKNFTVSCGTSVSWSFHKLGTVIVRNTDSLLMSSFVGLLSVGIYSNYKLVLSGQSSNQMDKFSNARLYRKSNGNREPIEDGDTGVQHLPGTGPALLRRMICSQRYAPSVSVTYCSRLQSPQNGIHC